MDTKHRETRATRDDEYKDTTDSVARQAKPTSVLQNARQAVLLETCDMVNSRSPANAQCR